MRPVERGPAPRTYARYADAIGDLENRLGRYCSYCERRLPTSLAVEHMAPKSLHRNRERDWSNFLLGCTNCNSVKGDKDVAEDDVLWPDRHNTMLALTYSRDGFVQAAEGLPPELGQRARALIDLVGLDRHGSHTGRPPTRRDRRWTDREEAWSIAESCRDRFESLDRSMEARDLVLAAAKGYGFFSVWFAVFEGHVDVRLALLDAVPGTAASCFDEGANLIRRPGAEI
ncbi:MAG: HNH endonuclease [Acidobacteria bacterium]|nr:HNH endonuclease [Acidobacteriota bacterium]